MHWKEKLWDLLDVFAMRRLTARIALSAGLLGLASSSTSDVSATPRVPVMPLLAPDAAVRKFKGRYVLKRAANSFFVHLAGHRSHSSHSSHRSHSSHSSHSSSSHYSGSHYSAATPSPPRGLPVVTEPTPTPVPVALVPKKPSEPTFLLRREFDVDAPNQQYLSQRKCNLWVERITVRLRHPASARFTAMLDEANHLGFRIDGNELVFESQTAGRIAAKRIPYVASRHRYLRLRPTDAAQLVVWETSADGKTWKLEYAETPQIDVTAMSIALSDVRAFRSVTAEPKP
jgi:hypothetical protein